VNRLAITVAVAVRDLTEDDLGWIAWSGGPDHPEVVAAALRWVDSGGVAYLAVCGTNDLPLALGGIDYRKASDGGALWQLAVHPGRQSCGLGSLLIASAEDRIRRTGLRQ
jgi:GNAT superfamily N-acetyltransferase